MRLEQLRAYEILDTEPEVGFDALTRVAVCALDAPAAVIGLLDAERLWFKSRLGLDVPEMDRRIAFCAHAIMRPGEVLVVEDLRLDARFKDGPFVANAPYLRFYAGCPLVDSRGYALGTIAVVDTRPRTLSGEQVALLRDLGLLVMAVLENRQHARMLSRMALTDHLTGLGNRAHFEKSLTAEMAHAARHDTPLSVLCMDLDGFKPINDQYGHSAGDAVLMEMGRRLRQAARAEDIVCRIGGDEFGVIARAARAADAAELAARISAAVAQPVVLANGARVAVGISIGTSQYTPAHTSGDMLLVQADRALYEMKRRNASRPFGLRIS